MRKYLFIPLLLGIAGLAVASGERRYISPMEESRWELTVDSPVLCQIEHQIPRFGRAVFLRQSGRALRLTLESAHEFTRGLKVALRSVTAQWRPLQTQALLANLETLGGAGPLIDVADDAARRAYFELQQGFQPSLFFVDLQDGFNPVSVVLSTVGFRDVEAVFGQCMQRLYPLNFDDMRQASLYFDFDQEFPLDGEEERALEPLLEYLRIDPSVNRVVISGYTDPKGSRCYNRRLSQRRARYVYDYLELSGIDPAMLEVEYFGEAYPSVGQRSDALNRRVTVKLLR